MDDAKELIAALKELTEAANCLRGSVEELNKHLIDLRKDQLHRDLQRFAIQTNISCNRRDEV